MTPAPLFIFLAQTPGATTPAVTTPTTTVSPAPTATTGTAPSTQPSLFQSPAVPLLFMAVIFYFLLIRPQQKRAKDQAALGDSLKSGDEVLTTSGIYGMITNVHPEEKAVTVKIADNVRVKMARESVTTVLNRKAGAATVASATSGDTKIAAKPVR